MVGSRSLELASGAVSGAAVGVVAGYTAMEGYAGISIEDMDDGGSHDGRCSRSSTCGPPFWKNGTMGTVQLA